MPSIQVGQRVEVNYYGEEIRGVVVEKRAITVKTDGASEFYVRRDNGEMQMFYAKFDGSPSNYDGRNTELRPI